MYVLGIHDGHNSAAVLLKDGVVVAGTQEERLTRVKNAMGLPKNAIVDVLNQAGIKPRDVDLIGMSGLRAGEYLDLESGKRPSEQVLEWHSECYKGNYSRSKQAVRSILGSTRVLQYRQKEIQNTRSQQLVEVGFNQSAMRFIEHHRAHACSAYYGWGRLSEPVLVLTNDGMGDELCATVSVGENGSLRRIASVPYSESVAEIYALTTFLMGMVPLEHEYKLMGMAPYASTQRAGAIADELTGLIKFNGNGGMTWHRRSDIPPLGLSYKNLEKIYHLQRFDYVCGGLQSFVETFIAAWVRNAIRETGIRKIALSGGIFMNVKANKVIMELPEVDDLFVFPSCGDETNAYGAACAAYYDHVSESGETPRIDPITSMYWGRDFSDEEVDDELSKYKFKKTISVETPQNMARRIAELLAEGKVVARFAGRMEFGARALGNRSILADPKRTEVIPVINAMIKNRDFWMPFAPSVAKDRSSEYMQNPKGIPAEYMILSFDSKPEKSHVFRAGIHPYDGTARPQEVSEQQNPDYYRLIKEFGQITGEEIILNTSFNLHGFPIVHYPKDAMHTFDESGLEYLAIGNILIKQV